MFKDLVIKNRSYRGYDSNFKVEKEILEELVEYTRYCASSSNKQVLRYRLVYEINEVSIMRNNIEFAKNLKNIELPKKGKEPTAFIIMCIEDSNQRYINNYQKDIGISAQTILLGACAKGLGGCMIGNFSSAKVKEELKLDKDLYPVFVIAIGKPDEEIVIEDADNGDIDYYRDERDVHYVPKRKLSDIIV